MSFRSEIQVALMLSEAFPPPGKVRFLHDVGTLDLVPGSTATAPTDTKISQDQPVRPVGLGQESPEIFSHEAVSSEAAAINTENINNYTPSIQPKTLLCHIVADSILPIEQRIILQELEKDMADKGYAEKVVKLHVPEGANFIAELRKVISDKQKEYDGYAVQFDVACPGTNQDTSLVKAVLDDQVLKELKVKALSFEPSDESEVAVMQVEGIILALRALSRDSKKGSVNDLLKAFKFLAGLAGVEVRSGLLGITDIDAFIRQAVFTAPTRRVKYEDIDKLNALMREYVRSAA